jgi:hypothetical protein
VKQKHRQQNESNNDETKIRNTLHRSSTQIWSTANRWYLV